MGQILARWRRPVAYRVALDLHHWAMQLALHRRIVMTIKIARNRGTFVC